MNWKTKLKWLAVIITVITMYSICKTVYNESAAVFNKSVGYVAEYDKKVNEQITTFDANYLAFIEKTKITNVNKETFIVVTDIIMNNRRDGQSLAWKWVQENQQIPFNEFTDFYRDLSSFVSSQYATLAAIERQKQQIVTDHNVMIDTYPNNIYNRWLNIKPLKYKAGFISDSTRALFKQ